MAHKKEKKYNIFNQYISESIYKRQLIALRTKYYKLKPQDAIFLSICPKYSIFVFPKAW